MNKEHKGGLPIRDFIARPFDFLRGISPPSLQEISAGQRLPRRQRIETGRVRRQALQEWQEGRRRLLKTGGLVLAGVAAGGVGVLARAAYEASKEDPFTGEIEEAKSYLQRWGKEVGEDPERLKQYLPKIVDLTIAFFSREMGYDRNQFKDKIVLLSRAEYKTKIKEMESKNLDERFNPAFIDNIVSEKMYVNSELSRNLRLGLRSRNSLAELAFFIVLHEMFHLSSPPIRHEPPIVAVGIPEKIMYEKGLGAFARNDSLSTKGREVYTKYRAEVEEIVVHHATIGRAKLLGISVEGTIFDELVQKYYSDILVPYYGGRGDELLRYQQHTDPDGFFRSIGEKLGANTPEAQLIKSNEFMINFLASR